MEMSILAHQHLDPFFVAIDLLHQFAQFFGIEPNPATLLTTIDEYALVHGEPGSFHRNMAIRAGGGALRVGPIVPSKKVVGQAEDGGSWGGVFESVTACPEDGSDAVDRLENASAMAFGGWLSRREA